MYDVSELFSRLNYVSELETLGDWSFRCYFMSPWELGMQIFLVGDESPDSLIPHFNCLGQIMWHLVSLVSLILFVFVVCVISFPVILTHYQCFWAWNPEKLKFRCCFLSLRELGLHIFSRRWEPWLRILVFELILSDIKCPQCCRFVF